MIRTLVDLEAEAERFVNSLAPSRRFVALSSAKRGATLITLSGELGAGKTTFAKAVAKTFGVEETVNSPTFVLEKIYVLPTGKPFRRLIHIDAYRLEKGSDLAPLSFDERMQDSGNLILLEWPEKVSDMLPTPVAHISFSAMPDGSHTISYG